MFKKYTKQQIQEAISFWKVILENKSPLLDDLVDEYGYGIVFHDVPVNATLRLFDNLFTCINKHVFSNNLRKWPFVIDDAACNIANALCGYVPDLVSNVKEQRYEVVLKDTIVDDILFVTPHYAFSSKLINGNECSLILAASLLAHEMIHQFNFEHEDEGSIKWCAVACGESYNDHGKNFEKWMDVANSKFGLDVKKVGKGKMSGLSTQAHDALKKFAGQDYGIDLKEDDKEDSSHGHKILKHTKDFSAFTMFM